MERIPTPVGAVLRFFRFSFGLNEQAFATKAKVDVSTVWRWEHTDVLTRDRLVELLDDLLDVPPEAVDEALSAHRRATTREEMEGPYALSDMERRLLGRVSVTAGQAGAETTRRELALERIRHRAARHTAWAAAEWTRLKKLPRDLQETTLQGHRGSVRSWALAVHLCEASEAAAAHSAAEALRLARLGVSLAREAPGSPRWRRRLLGHCEPFEANALRVGGTLPAAREAFARADEAWAEGEGGDPAGLLDATRRLDLKASLLRQDGRFEEAFVLLDQALAGSPPAAAARLLIKKATTHSRAGDYARAIEVLREAEPRLDQERDPRLSWVFHLNRSVVYCHLDQYEEAGAWLPLIEILAAGLRNKLDEVRTLWLRGRIRAGFGAEQEALAALAQVRHHFYEERIAYDYALVSLELATVYLEQGRANHVKRLAAELRWIFKDQGVHQEALAALALFCQAAEMHEAQAGWTRHLVKYLYQAQHNPSLRFDA